MLKYQEAMLFKEYLVSQGDFARNSKNPNVEQKELEISQKKKEEAGQQVTKLDLLGRFQAVAPFDGYINVIGNRSYGHIPELVAKMASLYITAADKEGVLTVPKHVPGHGRPLMHQGKN